MSGSINTCECARPNTDTDAKVIADCEHGCNFFGFLNFYDVQELFSHLLLRLHRWLWFLLLNCRKQIFAFVRRLLFTFDVLLYCLNQRKF